MNTNLGTGRHFLMSPLASTAAPSRHDDSAVRAPGPESGHKSLLPRKVYFIPDEHPYWLMSYYQSQCRNDPQWHHKGFENEQRAARFRWETRELEP